MPVEFYLHLGRSTNRIRVTIPTPVDAGVMEDDVYEPLKKKQNGPTDGDGARANLGVAAYMFIQYWRKITTHWENTTHLGNQNWEIQQDHLSKPYFCWLMSLQHQLAIFGGHLYHQFLATHKNAGDQQKFHDLIHDLIRLHLSWNFSWRCLHRKNAEKLQLLVVMNSYELNPLVWRSLLERFSPILCLIYPQLGATDTYHLSSATHTDTNELQHGYGKWPFWSKLISLTLF